MKAKAMVIDGLMSSMVARSHMPRLWAACWKVGGAISTMKFVCKL